MFHFKACLPVCDITLSVVGEVDDGPVEGVDGHSLDVLRSAAALPELRHWKKDNLSITQRLIAIWLIAEDENVFQRGKMNITEQYFILNLFQLRDKPSKLGILID